VVDVELRHLKRMDCFPDVVDAEARLPNRMDCFPDVVRGPMVLAQKVLRHQRFQLHALQPHALQPLPYVQSP
jgi:hypothetical protein